MTPAPSDRRPPRDPDRLRRRAGVRGDPARDQHFLVDDRVLDRIPGYLPGDADTSHLLEIGPGTGALTDRLLALGERGDRSPPDRVTVVERDAELAAFLRREFDDAVAGGRLAVVEGDALSVDLPDYTACVSNLPYGVSSGITFRLLPRGRPFVCTYQREFAERMVAEAGTEAYGRLSVSAQHYADVEIVERVPPEAFDPRPAVESAVVRAIPREPSYDAGDEEFFLDFVKALFTQRRKTTRNAVRNTAHISGLDDPDAVVAAADAKLLDRRPGDLPPAAFARLARLADARGRGDDSAGSDGERTGTEGEGER